jgi:zinc and cadmium transporter
MSALSAILVFGFAMACIALIGSLGLLLPDKFLKKAMLPMVAFAAGSLWGGAFFHMLPRSVHLMEDTPIMAFVSLTLGFLLFFVLEHIVHWHHCHKTSHSHSHSHSHSAPKPIGHMVLIADALHNLLGGLSIGALFIVDFKLGLAAWIAAALHEIPQEIGDFGLLIHSGFSKSKALLFNFASALTFIIGGLIAYFLAGEVNINFFIPFTAGNFIYIAAADIIPELIEYEKMKDKLISLLFFIIGCAMLLLTQHSHVH